MSDIAIEVNDISKYVPEKPGRFSVFSQHSDNSNRKRILDSISLNVKAGEIFGLIGLNGAGKTSLIKLILDLEAMEPVKGREERRKNGKAAQSRSNDSYIKIFGHDNQKITAKSYCGYLPEKLKISPQLTAMDYIKITAKAYGVSYRKERVQELAQRLDIQYEQLSQRLGKYSKGMMQKVGLIALLAVDSKILILDEPMSGLDVFARAKLRDILINCRDEGKTIFLSSHILSDVELLCDNILIIHQGQNMFFGSPAELREQHYAKSGNTNISFEECFLQKVS